jgi:hypothetical protein
MDEEVMFREMSDIKIKNTRLELFTGFQFVENPEYITKYSEMSMMVPEKLWLRTKQELKRVENVTAVCGFKLWFNEECPKSIE